MSKELYDYFANGLKKGVIDHKIRARFVDTSDLGGGDHRVAFYIHPDSKDGDTPSFLLDGNGKLLVTDGRTETPHCETCGKIMFQQHEQRGIFYCPYHPKD